jgi:hypothetical protein
MKCNNNNDDKDNEAAGKAWNDLSHSLDDVWDLTGRTMGRMSNLFSVYGDRIQDRLEDTLFNGNEDKRWPRVGSLGWFPDHNRDDHDSCVKGKMWGYPVPSMRQYDRCKENDGVSVWSRDGVWRCLFPNVSDAKEQLKNLDIDGNNGTRLEDQQWFSDYSFYLDWRRAMRKAEEAKREQEWQRSKQHYDSLWSDKPTEQKSKVPTKYVSELEAEKQGKNVISTSVVSETVSREDGTLETKRIVKKWYDDDTVSVSETVNTGLDNDNKGGWFWK